ncbi:MAG: hypothetical protein IBX63_06970 [Coriobacteriia bacterium]|nr:hypothetical protein [Coriobacteriia bacterium]
MSLIDTTPELLAEAIRKEYGRPQTSAPFPVEGACNAARHIVSALERHTA